MEKLVKLFGEESKIVFADGTVFNGAVEVAGCMKNVISKSATYGLTKGLKIGFVGGVVASGIGIVAYGRYLKTKSE